MTEKLVFTGEDSNGNYDLFISDGTPGGTTELPVNNAWTGINGLDPTGESFLNGQVYFNAEDAAGNNNLWVTNGTTAGTSELTLPGQSADLDPSNLTVLLGSFLFFDGTDSGGNEGFWYSDGTPQGTSELTTQPTWQSYPQSVPHDFAVSTGGFNFIAGTSGQNQLELWVSDGAAGGTSALAVNNESGSSGLNASYLISVNGQLFFSGTDASQHTNLFTSNVTGPGTSEVIGIDQNAGGLQPTDLAYYDGPMGGYAYFEGVDSAGQTGLWVSGGNPL